MRIIGIFVFILFAVTNMVAQETVNTGYASMYPTAKENAETTSGENYSSRLYTASHASLPYGTILKVTNIYNHKFVYVKINDHFSFKNYRLVDLSKVAANQIDLFDTQLPKVAIEVVGFNDMDLIASNTAPNFVASASKTETPKTTVAKSTTKSSEILVQPNTINIAGFKLPTLTLEQANKLAHKSLVFISLGLLK